METAFTFSNAIELAILEEKKAVRSYERLANGSLTDAEKKNYLSLAQFEKNHIKALENIKKNHDLSKIGNFKTELKEEKTQYNVYTSASKKTFSEIIFNAINEEDKATQLYIRLAKQTSKHPEISEIFVRLAKEEAGHKAQLQEIYRKTKNKLKKSPSHLSR